MRVLGQKKLEGGGAKRPAPSLYRVKGTVHVIISNPPFIDWYVRFTTAPLKAMNAQE